MPSLFPGMDPYIEASYVRDDFHHDLISGIKNALTPLLPPRYVIRAGERSYVTLTASRGVDEYRMQADVTIARKADEPPATAQPATTATLEATNSGSAPVTMRALVHTKFREGFLEIREARGDRQVVTGIEVLSPSNKRFGSKGWRKYLRKRNDRLSDTVNFVEIDLLRHGHRRPTAAYRIVERLLPRSHDLTTSRSSGSA